MTTTNQVKVNSAIILEELTNIVAGLEKVLSYRLIKGNDGWTFNRVREALIEDMTRLSWNEITYRSSVSISGKWIKDIPDNDWLTVSIFYTPITGDNARSKAKIRFEYGVSLGVGEIGYIDKTMNFVNIETPLNDVVIYRLNLKLTECLTHRITDEEEIVKHDENVKSAVDWIRRSYGQDTEIGRETIIQYGITRLLISINGIQHSLVIGSRWNSLNIDSNVPFTISEKLRERISHEVDYLFNTDELHATYHLYGIYTIIPKEVAGDENLIEMYFKTIDTVRGSLVRPIGNHLYFINCQGETAKIHILPIVKQFNMDNVEDMVEIVANNKHELEDKLTEWANNQALKLTPLELLHVIANQGNYLAEDKTIYNSSVEDIQFFELKCNSKKYPSMHLSIISKNDDSVYLSMNVTYPIGFNNTNGYSLRVESVEKLIPFKSDMNDLESVVREFRGYMDAIE